MVVEVEWTNLHQQMDYLAVLVVVVDIILATDLVDLELLVKEILVGVEFGFLVQLILVEVAVELVLLVVMEDLRMVMLDLVVMAFRFLQRLEIQLLRPAIHQIHLHHKEVVV
jgi:hypothetical protein